MESSVCMLVRMCVHSYICVRVCVCVCALLSNVEMLIMGEKSTPSVSKSLSKHIDTFILPIANILVWNLYELLPGQCMITAVDVTYLHLVLTSSSLAHHPDIMKLQERI